ncbi:ankyrin repeat protein [Fadolivirus algeromassiliense]|jgi:hypothetical protein|uniref:Ankyrin repeat protein n=1 Tax=Fadolivirus FV1/VV64 TaxID=3070911 RepID=A0A7D3QXD9_9VIRU|nr:ankyrin repeat protein [Fadolivirus algeromassiliense]QKF94400.1 ankyrin repeat protein [Fadolivirus FV1/VV64]
MQKDNLLKYLTCPITQLIFCDPVMAEDGHLYEFMAIKNHITRNNTSPVTNEKMGNMLIRAVKVKAMIDDFLVDNPEYKSNQFLFRKPFYLFTKEFIDNLREKKYEQLKEYTNVILNTEIGKESLFELVCKNCPDDVVKYIIDNSIDYDVYDKRKLKPIHSVCKYGSKDVLMYIAKKGVDLNSEDMNGETPLSYLLLYRTKEDYNAMIPEFLELGVDVNKSNKNGYTVAHLTINNGDLPMLQLLVTYGLTIGTVSQKLGGLNVLQYAFRESKGTDVIKYIIDLNQNLDVDVDPKTSCEQLIYLNQNLDKKQRQQLVLYYLTKILNKPVVEDNFIDSVMEKH